MMTLRAPPTLTWRFASASPSRTPLPSLALRARLSLVGERKRIACRAEAQAEAGGEGPKSMRHWPVQKKFFEASNQGAVSSRASHL